MFVDLMSDIYNTFADRFLKVQLQFGPPPQESGDGGRPARSPAAPAKRFNALGVLEDSRSNGDSPEPSETALDIAPDEPPKQGVLAKKDPVIVGAGRTRSLTTPAPADVDWSSVGRNDPCPCGSGKKFKKCHGATL